jgi:NADH-quinone oxidoreductase subunit G
VARIFVDGTPYEVKDGQNLLSASLSLGFDLPYFCWHPAMGSVGACRQCAVKQFRDENDTRGRMVMACMTPAADGTRISIHDPEAVAFRAHIIEWLMVNHPHDCPVCDEGGECHLQDMTVMTGHTYREFRFGKRTHRNQNLGPFVNHEMNRCIACYRCTRFYRDYAGGRDFDVFSWHDSVYFGRSEDGVLENEFSGNLIEVCPTGVFDDKTLMHHYSRKWDFQTAPSICVHCGLGCNTIAGERYGQLRRIRNRYHSQVNGYFLCDRGRFGYEFVNSDRRIRQPVARSGPGRSALEYAAALLARKETVIGIGSPRASLESNFALRALVGPDHFYHGISETQYRGMAHVVRILQNGAAPAATLGEVENADAVFVLGEDVTNTAPRLALAIRQAVQRQPQTLAEKLKIPLWDDAAVRELLQDRTGPLFIASPYSTRLDEVATRTFRAAPDELARLGFAVAHAFDAEAPASDEMPLAEEIAQKLQEAERPLIVCGTTCGSQTILEAAANVAMALSKRRREVRLSFVVPECNSLGLALLGGQGSLAAAAKAEADTVIVLENDLSRRIADESLAALFGPGRQVIAFDYLANHTTQKADVVFPAATFAESTGTVVNNEGRAQRFYKVFDADGRIQESWRWLDELMLASGRVATRSWINVDAIDAALAGEIPIFAPIVNIAPPADFRIAGERIPRQPHRSSGRTAMDANVDVHEPRTHTDPDSPLAFTMEGYSGEAPAPLIPRFWAPGWNSVQVLNKFQEEIAGPLRGGDPGRRLIEPASKTPASYFSSVPPRFTTRAGEWLLVPISHLFGSEELSVLTPGIAELMPKPYVALNPHDAEQIHIKEGEDVVVGPLRLPLKLMSSLPEGVAGVPAGLPGMPTIDFPTNIQLGDPA